MRLIFAFFTALSIPAVAAAQSPMSATMTPVNGATGVEAGSSIQLALRVVLPEGLHAQSNKPKDESLIATTLTFEKSADAVPVEAVFPPATEFKLDTGDTLLVFEHEFLIGVQVRIVPERTPGPITVSARLRYQPCNNLMCFRPITTPVSWTFPVVPAGTKTSPLNADVMSRIAWGTGSVPGAAPPTPPPAAPAHENAAGLAAALDGFAVSGTTGGYLSVDSYLKFIHDAEAGVVPRGMFEGRGPLAILLVVFFGGMALNLTPCVLPMIPINLAIIGAGGAFGAAGAGAQSKDKTRGFLLGLAYGGAMAIVYGVLGLVVILTAGTFGSINASPWFNFGIAALFVVLGLAMFDIGVIDFSRWSSSVRFNSLGRGTVALAFGMGAVAALLAGACVAPVVIQVVVFASNLYATGSSQALALPFVLGLGMAAPWPFAGAGLSKLPKPGAWMNRVKYAFGIFILATAAYYGYLGYELVASRWVNQADVRASADEKLREGWHSSLEEGLAEARATGKPVLVDMWATWCKNCLTMDKTTLADERVKTALAGYVKVKFQAEDLDDPATNDLMKRFGAVGLPAYGILK